MNTAKEAFEAKVYDETEEIKVSSTITEQEIENISDSNANDNGDGDFTPPPLQNKDKEADTSASALDEEQIEAECAKLNYQVALAANRCLEEKFSANLSLIPKENHSMVIPDDPKELDSFIKVSEAALNAADKILHKLDISAQE